MPHEQIKYIVVHCSATDSTVDIGADEIRQWHVEENGWRDIGYHYVIRRNGAAEEGRNIFENGAHVAGYNIVSKELKDYRPLSWGICLVGGVNESGHATNNFTPEQFDTLEKLIRGLRSLVPMADIVGHRDLSPDVDGDGVVEEHEWMKACPCFDVSEFVKSRGLG